MSRSLPLKTRFLRGVLVDSARILRRVYREISRLPAESRPPVASWLLGQQWFIQSQIEELGSALSQEYCQQLIRAEGYGQKAEPRVYSVISSTLGCVISSPLAPQALGKLLTTAALAELFNPDRLGTALTLAELWAIPPIVRLVLIEKIARSVSDRPLDSSHCESVVLGAIGCLHSLGRIRWQTLIESISTVHHILSRDPAGIYLEMDFESRDLYRHRVEGLAKQSERSEESVATLAATLAGEAVDLHDDSRRSHVGYYLVGSGIADLRKRGGLRVPWPSKFQELALRFPNLVYIGGIAIATAAVASAIYHFAGPLAWWWVVMLWLPSSAPAITLVNLLVNSALPRRPMPRLDFSKGIPDEHRTFVVVPTLLLSRPAVERLFERLEIHYLANRDCNLVFGLLTDFPDSSSPVPSDHPLVEFCANGIRRLNRRYSSGGRSPFYLFHRGQQWNQSQRAWMGRERKRGKLEDFHRLLLGLDDAFEVKIGDLSAIGSIRNVITLDTDTQLPRDTAWKLVGSLAHPLQKPVIHPISKTIQNGCTILQPRVSTSMESAGRSRFSRIFNRQTGLDQYTTAIADVYHDLYGQANFTGKGIYDLRAFHAVFDGRFPANTLLSHDLIEGEHAGVGFATDVDVIEDHPSSYEVYAKRKHRWIRGDWQLLCWLLPRVPRGDGSWIPNPLRLCSRWKLADNLRRSLFEISLLLVIVAGWTLAPSASVRITFAALGILVFPAYVAAVNSLFDLPPVRFWPSHFRERAAEFWRAHQEAWLWLVVLPDQALVAADGIARTLIRRFVTGRSLLDWESMAQVEAGENKSFRWSGTLLLVGLVCAAAIGFRFRNTAPWLPLLLLTHWIASPLVASFVKASPHRGRRYVRSEVAFLRDISLRTWRYFADFGQPEDHWLIPDNVQEEPRAIAHHTSPTNIGLQLAGNVAAYDFGYIAPGELAGRIGDLLNTMRRLEKYRGHFLNWYDTRTLTPDNPRYVSTVDSGNLAAALIAVKQACEGMRRQPLISEALLEGVRDHCVRLWMSLPPAAQQPPVTRLVGDLMATLRKRPKNLFQWQSVLHGATLLIARLKEHIDATFENLGAGEAESLDEVRYWQRALGERAQAAVGGLLDLAPWLAERYTEQLRRRSSDCMFENLIGALATVPELGDLSNNYDRIEQAITQLLDSSAACAVDMRALLVGLREDVVLARVRARALVDRLTRNERTAGRFARAMDFAFLYDPDCDLLRVGYAVQAERLDECCYDLLASEARTAAFLAVAKGDAPRRTWFRLGRRLASFRGHTTLLSWSGTMFEYLMPALFMKTFSQTLLGDTLNGVVQVQQAYARELDVPWGISESSCCSRSRESHYDYHAFGIPAVSLRRSQPDNLVVAPYASMLALMIAREPATQNLRLMDSRGWTGRYGFFEAVDFWSGFSVSPQTAIVVRSFMAHHQGMGLLALCNALLGNRMQERFHAEPMVAATELLLQERAPALTATEEQTVTAPELAVVSVDA
ncbi:MAG TPA: glucoamylase family protein [Bryobacteraceae bacterium]|nr:glucoamylase family protein [Bryobacteraceae bacterium]